MGHLWVTGTPLPFLLPDLSNGNGLHEGVKLTKEECINHVSKTLGIRLRNLKAEVAVKATKTGKTSKRDMLGEKNKLTENVIDQLTSYYDQALYGECRKNWQCYGKTFYQHITSIMNQKRHLHITR